MARQVEKNKTFFQALGHALDGLVFAVKTERNLRFHLLAALLALFLGLVLGCTALEWLFLLLSVCLVIGFELVNTLVEILVDALSGGNYYDWAKHAKDMAAGLVVLSALFACLVAVLVFGPKILLILGF